MRRNRPYLCLQVSSLHGNVHENLLYHENDHDRGCARDRVNLLSYRESDRENVLHRRGHDRVQVPDAKY